MEVPGSRQLDLPKLSGVLGRMFSPVEPVEPSFRLLDPIDQQTEDGLYEFYGHNREVHLLMFNRDGNIGRDHEALSERGVHVFPSIHSGDATVLAVPEGARSLHNILRLVARDTAGYGVIFEQLGQAIRQLENVQLGLPMYGSVLDRFAWAPDETSQSGGSIFLVPPYQLEHGTAADTMISNVQNQLITSGLFNEGEQTNLMRMIENGRQRIG